MTCSTCPRLPPEDGAARTGHCPFPICCPMPWPWSRGAERCSSPRAMARPAPYPRRLPAVEADPHQPAEQCDQVHAARRPSHHRHTLWGRKDIRLTVGDSGIGAGLNRTGNGCMSQYGQIDSRVARRHQGTGLGLPIFTVLALLHGGTLEDCEHAGRRNHSEPCASGLADRRGTASAGVVEEENPPMPAGWAFAGTGRRLAV